MKHTARIRRNADGAEVDYCCCDQPLPPGSDPDEVDLAMFMWSEGNYGCDCNRDLFFNRVHLGDPEYWHEEGTPAAMCGEKRYSVLSIKFEDGREIYPDAHRT